ncbi:hypothetical protein [uncultured Jannaschia sp.]|uniref:hypothetical protein n=1 Tax=uncultured Jannaschia sp. TaxID=293347 RepID=UPI0026369F86|nr:hypothetical protein [uncultured Jannaschia sp.]
MDESGTPGDPDFMLGTVAIAARDVAVAGSVLARLRPGNAGEIHAVDMAGRDARVILERLQADLNARGVIFLNKASAHHQGAASEVYAAAVIEVTKVAIQRYAALKRIPKIGNVELLLDRTGINTSMDCQAALTRAQRDDGRFKAVSHIAMVDSCAVPFLQIADLNAYARRWISSGEITAKQLRDECGVELL